jgi:GNAT superfamily N-acetyltransferase
MNNVQIRKANHEDLRVIQEIARGTIDKSYRSFLGDELVDWFLNSGESDKELENQLVNCDVLVLDTSIAAFAIYFDDLIHLMMVDAYLHRNGLGARLLAHTETQLFNSGNTVIRVETFEGNQQAINFYKKYNWSIVRTEEDKENGFVRVFFEKHA